MARTMKSAAPKAALPLLALLAACQGVADLKQVEKERQKTVFRTDQFQAVASNGKFAAAVGNGVIVVTDVTGVHQSRALLPGAPALIAVSACPDGSFVALDFNRKVWLADADAKNWRAQPISGTWRPLALTCDSANRYWVVGSGTTIAHSVDRGATWTEKNFGEDAMFNTVQFLDSGNGVVTGEFGTVMTTADGGATWTAAEKIPADFYPYAALFTSRQTGYLSGLTGTMLHTNDGGKSWQKLENTSGLPQFGFVRQGDALYSVGAGGSMLKLEKDAWKPVDVGQPAAAYLRSATDIGNGRLMVAGGSGALQIVPAATAKSPG